VITNIPYRVEEMSVAPNTGRLYSVLDAQPGAVTISGQLADIANVSAAVRVQAEPEMSIAQARQRAMDELRAINRHERARGR
jgi:hypothetical protein